MRAEELIAQLAAEGELDSDGSFTLDPAVALDKLRAYQLGDPTRFVLSWVRAGNLLGATRIDIEADADDVWVRFDGEPLARRELEELWSAVVGLRGTAHVRALRELALGINGAFAWEAKSVVVRSDGVEARIDREFAIAVREVEAGTPTTVVHAKRPLGWDLVRRRMLDARAELPEELLLARLCARGRVPVVLEGRRLEPPRERINVWFRVDIDDDERHGWLRLREGTESVLRVLVAGVELLTMPLAFGVGQLEVQIDDPRLPLDLSQERPVEGERWQSLLELVARARWRAWFGLAVQRGWPGAALARPGAAEHRPMQALLADIHASSDRRWTEAAGALAFADALPLPLAVTRPFGDVQCLQARADRRARVVWPWPIDEPTPTTLGDVVRRADAGGELFVSSAVREDLVYLPELPVVQHESAGLAVLGAVSLADPRGEAQYRRAVQDRRSLAGERALPDHFVQVCDRVAQGEGELRVRVGWERGLAGRRPGCLCLGRAGKLLARVQLPDHWGPLWAEIEGPIDPSDPIVLASCVLALLGCYHDLLAALERELSAFERELVRDYLCEAHGRWSAVRLHELDQIPVAAREQAIASWRGAWGVPDVWVELGRREPAACEHPIAALPWLEQHGRCWSLHELQREVARAGTLEWVAAFETRPTPAAVWRLDGETRVIIERLLPGALRRFDHHAQRRVAPGSQRVPEQIEHARVSTPLRGSAGEHGLLALVRPGAAWARPPRRSARVLVLGRGHALGYVDLPLPTGSFVGVIEVPHARAVAHADAVLRDGAWTAVAELVEAGARTLVHTLLEQWASGHIEPDDASWLRDWLLDLERGRWPDIAHALTRWQAELDVGHPLRAGEG